MISDALVVCGGRGGGSVDVMWKFLAQTLRVWRAGALFPIWKFACDTAGSGSFFRDEVR
jgi:hypothetical protein